MRTCRKSVKEIIYHTEHMPHRQHGNDMIARFNGKHLEAVSHIRPKTAIGEHHSFRVTCGAGSIIDNSQFFRMILSVANMFRAEVLGILSTIYCIPVFKSISEFLVA